VDLKHAVDIPNSEWSLVARAIRLLLKLAPGEALNSLENSNFRQFNFQNRLDLAAEMAGETTAQRFAEKLLRELMPEASRPEQLQLLYHSLSLVLIATGQFNEAKATITMLPQWTNDIVHVFNYAVADWAESGHPSPELFQQAIQLQHFHVGRLSPNFAQCMALAHWFVGDHQGTSRLLDLSRQLLSGIPFSAFSVWRYAKASVPEFIEDLNAMERMFSGGEMRPIFMRQRQLFDMDREAETVA